MPMPLASRSLIASNCLAFLFTSLIVGPFGPATALFFRGGAAALLDLALIILLTISSVESDTQGMNGLEEKWSGGVSFTFDFLNEDLEVGSHTSDSANVAMYPGVFEECVYADEVRCF